VLAAGWPAANPEVNGSRLASAVDGTEGDEWQGAQAVEPSCYRAGGAVAAPAILSPSCSSAATIDRCDTNDTNEQSHVRRLAVCTLKGVWRWGVVALLVPPDGPRLLSGVAALIMATLVACLLGRRWCCSRMVGMVLCEGERRSLLRVRPFVASRFEFDVRAR
jgi:hypothetical protein